MIPPAEGISAEVGNDGADKSNADHGCNRSVECITCTAEASHIDDLTDLENDNKDYDMHNLDSNCHNVVFREKQMVETAGTKIVDCNQTDSDDSTDETAGSSVFFGKIQDHRHRDCAQSERQQLPAVRHQKQRKEP